MTNAMRRKREWNLQQWTLKKHARIKCYVLGLTKSKIQVCVEDEKVLVKKFQGRSQNMTQSRMRRDASIFQWKEREALSLPTNSHCLGMP